MSFDVSVDRRSQGVCVVTLGGRLDTAASAQCEAALAATFLDPPRILVFDLARLTFIGSLGLRILFRARKIVEGRGGVVAVTNPQPAIVKVFQVVAALPAERVFASVNEADAYLAQFQEWRPGDGGS
ncbi:MAG TPA: STAS domain-containing protein [Thermoanaerobaculia bacterium]|nr:STAS domain-containing protein [Thermoanaerobaculia bacterium]